VGSVEFHDKQKQPSSAAHRRHKPRYDVDVLVAELPHERQSTVFEQFITINKQLSELSDTENAASPFDNLDCAAYECPFLLRKDFFDLFPTSDVSMTHNLTVITLSQKQTNKTLPQSDAKMLPEDETKKSQQEETKMSQQEEMDNATEDDSKSLMNDFVTAATDICQLLHSAGYWADFLDPTSGRPYVDAHVNASQYEVDERYRRCGFEIESSTAGQCRVLRHHALGSKSFVGCVFTSAPTDHPLIANFANSQS